MPGLLRKRADEHREIFPVAKPDPDDLERFMFIPIRPTSTGGRATAASRFWRKGRSAVTLLVWLEEIVRPAGVRSSQ